MSTRCSINHREQELEKAGFHLWEDAFERLDQGSNAPVYLRLEGVEVCEMATQFAGASLTVKLPRELAVALGLVAGNTGEVQK